MLDLAVQHIKGLQSQVQVCKSTLASTVYDFLISMHSPKLKSASYEYGILKKNLFSLIGWYYITVKI